MERLENPEGQNKAGFSWGILPFSILYSWMELPFCFSKNQMGMMAIVTR